MYNKLLAVSVFSGGGLMDLGAHLAGIPTIYGLEIDPRFAAFHAMNFKHPDGSPVIRIGDVRKLDMDEVLEIMFRYYGPEATIAFLMGGPTCTDFTPLNKKRNKGPDSNCWLVIDYLDVVQKVNPLIAVMEQVPDFLTDDFFFPLFVEKARAMNYNVVVKVMNALLYEGNSIRERAVTILVRNDLNKMPVFPEPIPSGIKMSGDFLEIEKFKSGHFNDRDRYPFEPMTTVTGGSPKRFYKNKIWRNPNEREIMLCQSVDPAKYILPKKYSYSVFRKVFGNGVPTMMAYHIFRTLISEVLELRKNESGIWVSKNTLVV